jgi:hypothetical protein
VFGANQLGGRFASIKYNQIELSPGRTGVCVLK